MSPIAPSRSSFEVVPSSRTVTPSFPVGPLLECGANFAFVTTIVPSTPIAPTRVEHVVEHRPAADLEQRLRLVERERVQPRRVPGGEDECLHACTDLRK